MSQMGQDQMSVGVSILCWLAAPVANALWKPPGIMSKTVIRSSSVTRLRFSEMSYQWRVPLYMIMSQNVMQHLGEDDFIMFHEIPISTIELSEGRFQRPPTYPCPRSLHESRAALRIKHSKIVKRLRRRQYDPLIIETTIGLVLGPCTALCRLFLKHCTLTNKAVGTI